MSQQYKLPLTGKQVEEKLENTILTPITASVGQTVKISAVDANGKPTAWEAVDFSEGGTTSTYTNQLPLATDTDRTTVYNDNGYIDGYRLSSSGGISAQDGMSATGFIPATPGQTIRIKGATPMQGKNNYIIAYKADNTVSKYASMAYDSTGWITPHDGWMKYENGVIIILLTSTMFGSDFNAIRFCSAQLSDDVIVTVNEKIVDAIPTITTASVGQTIKVSAVDENGRPTAWEAANLEEVWELIADVTIEEEIQTVAQLWEPMKKVRIEVYTPAAAADTNYMPVTVYTTDDNSRYFRTGVFYPTALPRKSEYRSEYRITMEKYNDEIIMRFTESNDLARNSGRVVGVGTLKEATSDGNCAYADKFENVYTTGMHLHSYSLFPVGTTFKFWGVRA